ncbi:MULTISPECIES: hypothetical protein [unclassified Bradyrhizobium]|uniref:hypothetical protein n=1 Tax=unclassified Bradyrhizobium TaxID=2631580 RepID=UPI0033928421
MDIDNFDLVIRDGDTRFMLVMHNGFLAINGKKIDRHPDSYTYAMARDLYRQYVERGVHSLKVVPK